MVVKWIGVDIGSRGIGASRRVLYNKCSYKLGKWKPHVGEEQNLLNSRKEKVNNNEKMFNSTLQS